MEVTPVDRRPADRSTAVDHALTLLRRAVADCDYTLDALEADMGKGRAHIHRVLQGERALTLEFLTALPTDVKARFAQLSAERLGFIVVKPVRGEEGIRQFVSGLLGLLTEKVA